MAGRSRTGAGELIERGRGPTRTTKPFAVADTTSTQCRSSGVFQRPPTFNIEPSLLETLAAGTSRSML